MSTATPTVRTQEEILARIEEIKPKEFFGFETADLIGYLDYDHAKPFLKEEVKEEEWKKEDQYKVKDQMIEYMSFAFEKAFNQRGISAGRSLNHYSAWLWIDGNVELAEKIRDYEDYGVNQLREICQYLGIDPTKHGDLGGVPGDTGFED